RSDGVIVPCKCCSGVNDHDASVVGLAAKVRPRTTKRDRSPTGDIGCPCSLVGSSGTSADGVGICAAAIRPSARLPAAVEAPAMSLRRESRREAERRILPIYAPFLVRGVV